MLSGFENYLMHSFTLSFLTSSNTNHLASRRVDIRLCRANIDTSTATLDLIGSRQGSCTNGSKCRREKGKRDAILFSKRKFKIDCSSNRITTICSIQIWIMMKLWMTYWKTMGIDSSDLITADHRLLMNDKVYHTLVRAKVN